VKVIGEGYLRLTTCEIAESERDNATLLAIEICGSFENCDVIVDEFLRESS
jgi:hypothetical protein